MPKERQRTRFQLKNIAFVSWVTIAVLVVMSIGAVFGAKFALKSKPDSGRKEISVLDDLKYDIIIRAHQSQYEGMNPEDIPETGYATHYYYVLVNSELKEQYRLTYTDVWNNELNGYDTLSFSKSPIDQSEIESLDESYERSDKLKSVRELIDSKVEEKYIVTVSEFDLVEYNVDEESTTEETTEE